MIALITKLFILKKKTGNTPRAKPTVLIPKAKPGVSGKAETNIASVIAIVMLKNMTPINEIVMILSPSIRKGKAPNMLM